MKNKVFFAIITFVLIHLNAYSMDTAKVKSRFVGSHGYILESGTKKIAIDGLIYLSDNQYGYIMPSVRTKEKMELLAAPFDSIDLILVGHGHSEHFNSKIIEKVMLRNKNAVAIMPQEVYDAMKTETDSLSKYSSRIIVPTITFFNSWDTVICDIPITITNLKHGPDKKMNLFTFNFTIGGIRFVHLIQWTEFTAEQLDTFGFNKQRADVALLGFSYITDNNKFELFKKMNPRYTELGHIEYAAKEIAGLQSKIEALKDKYRINLIDASMEALIYKKVGDTVITEVLNNSPILKTSIKDTTITLGVNFELSLPDNMFTDIDKDNLKIFTNQKNSTVLPSWLKFSDGKFSGIPNLKGIYNIEVTSSDSYGAETTDIFSINVVDAVSLKEQLKIRSSIYPNPAIDVLNFNIKNSGENTGMIELYNSEGTLVLKKVYNQSGEIKIDVSVFPRGIYIVKASTGKSSFFEKICLK